MRKILLTQGQFAILDNEDYDMINQYKWCANYYKSIHTYYAVRNTRKTNGKQKTQLMHRVIMNCSNDKQIDHINHNTLDNRKSNLRICTQNQNQYNQRLHKKTSSKYKGVYLQKQKCKNKVHTYWVSYISFNGKKMYLGHSKTEIEGAKVYNKKAKELFGDFAYLNVIGGK